VKRAVLFIAATVFLVLAFSGVALAATPQDIYDDYAADNHLDGTYTNAELRAYLNSGLVHQYGDPVILTALDELVTDLLAARNRFPFTGAEMALVAFGLCALAGAGLGFRRLARSPGVRS
jgi:hypothetical protein